MNYHIDFTAEEAVPCSIQKFEEVNNLFNELKEDFPILLYMSLENGELYICGENGTLDVLLSDENLNKNGQEKGKEFLTKLGEVIAEADLRYLDFGVAFSCDKLAPGSHGGTAFRLYLDGSIKYRSEFWEEESIEALTSKGPQKAIDERNNNNSGIIVEGPYKCPDCGGSACFEASYLDRETNLVLCPYCGTQLEI